MIGIILTSTYQAVLSLGILERKLLCPMSLLPYGSQKCPPKSYWTVWLIHTHHKYHVLHIQQNSSKDVIQIVYAHAHVYVSVMGRAPIKQFEAKIVSFLYLEDEQQIRNSANPQFSKSSLQQIRVPEVQIY